MEPAGTIGNAISDARRESFGSVEHLAQAAQMRLAGFMTTVRYGIEHNTYGVSDAILERTRGTLERLQESLNAYNAAMDDASAGDISDTRLEEINEANKTVGQCASEYGLMGLTREQKDLESIATSTGQFLYNALRKV